MKKKEIECEYCHTLFTEDDSICPNCGANTSKAIKKHLKEKEEKRKKEQEQAINIVSKFAKDYTRGQIIVSIIAAIIFVAFAIFIYVNYTNSVKKMRNNSLSDKKTEIIEKEEKENEKVTVGYQEEAINDEMRVIIDSYELYEYHSDHFDNYNTPDGYQKIAFHFSIENIGNSNRFLNEAFDEGIHLTVDDYEVSQTSLKAPGESFATVTQGKEVYEDISNSTLRAGSIIKGYIGYLVPKDKQKLKFQIGKYTFIEMNNPVYNG